MNMPTVNSSESPGSNENRPHSAKTMSATTQSAQGPAAAMIFSGSSQSGSSRGTVSSGVSKFTGQRYLLIPWEP